jgi:hypothetical protein
MGYDMQFPANQLGGQIFLWVMKGYGLSEAWVKRGSTVISYISYKGTQARLKNDLWGIKSFSRPHSILLECVARQMNRLYIVRPCQK